jgi:hypothetical protein
LSCQISLEGTNCPRLAAHLAGGFTLPITSEILEPAIQEAFSTADPRSDRGGARAAVEHPLALAGSFDQLRGETLDGGFFPALIRKPAHARRSPLREAAWAVFAPIAMLGAFIIWCLGRAARYLLTDR